MVTIDSPAARYPVGKVKKEFALPAYNPRKCLSAELEKNKEKSATIGFSCISTILICGYRENSTTLCRWKFCQFRQNQIESFWCSQTRPPFSQYQNREETTHWPEIMAKHKEPKSLCFHSTILAPFQQKNFTPSSKGKLSIHQKPYFLQHYIALQYTSLLLKDKETTPAMLLANIYVYKNNPWLTSAIDWGDPPLAAVTMTKPFWCPNHTCHQGGHRITGLPNQSKIHPQNNPQANIFGLPGSETIMSIKVHITNVRGANTYLCALDIKLGLFHQKFQHRLKT